MAPIYTVLFFVLWINVSLNIAIKTYGSNSWMTLSNRNTENNLVENAVERTKKLMKFKKCYI